MKINFLHKAFLIPCLIAFAYSPVANAQQSSAQVKVITAQNTAVQTAVNKTAAGVGMQLYNIQLTNSSKQAQNLKWVNVTVTPGQLIPKGTPYAIGADEMLRYEGNMIITQTGKATRNNDNNMYLMFKNKIGYMLVGVISWRTFLCQIFTDNGVVHINGDGDNRELKAGQKLPFEKVVCLYGKSWQDLLDTYADLIVKENHVAKPPKIDWKGWATWDFYVQHFLPEDVSRNTGIIKDMNVGTNIIQIDGGWWVNRGDYFDVRENIPGGIKAVIEKIHQSGFKAGLHFDGYRVSKAAKIVKEHPEYFIHNADGSFVEIGKDVVSKQPLVFWDYSHPGAQKYITDVMRNARENWKVDYFKIDFMVNGLMAKGKSYLPVTNVERYRMGIEAMRKGIGSAYFLACSPNFGVNIGLIEATRTGPDINPDYEAAKERVEHNTGSYYFSNKIYNCDPDYLVLRSEKESNKRDGKKPSLNYDQAAMWANFVSIYGNVRLESDELSLLPDDKKQLIKKAFAMPFFERTVPIDWWDHYKNDSDAPNIFLAKGRNGEICLGLFNWGDTDLQFNVTGFTKGGKLVDFHSQQKYDVKNAQLTVPLKGVHSVLLKYTGTDSFESLCKKLALNKK